MAGFNHQACARSGYNSDTIFNYKQLNTNKALIYQFLAHGRNPAGTENIKMREISNKILESIGTMNLPEIKPSFLLFLAYIWRAQVKVGLINLCKRLFSLNARIYYKLKSGT